jgi:hypothetical protein
MPTKRGVHLCRCLPKEHGQKMTKQEEEIVKRLERQSYPYMEILSVVSKGQHSQRWGLVCFRPAKTDIKVVVKARLKKQVSFVHDNGYEVVLKPGFEITVGMLYRPGAGYYAHFATPKGACLTCVANPRYGKGDLDAASPRAMAWLVISRFLEIYAYNGNYETQYVQVKKAKVKYPAAKRRRYGYY